MNPAIREQAHEHFLLLNHNGHRRRQQVGAVPADDDVDLVDVEQLLVEGGDRRRIGLIVVVDELDSGRAPPLTLTSSSQIRRSSSADLLLGASPQPVLRRVILGTYRCKLFPWWKTRLGPDGSR